VTSIARNGIIFCRRAGYKACDTPPKLALCNQPKQECHVIDSHGEMVRASVLLLAYDQNRTVSVPDHTVRDTPHKSPPHSA
jgi:hypothetical protein